MEIITEILIDRLHRKTNRWDKQAKSFSKILRLQINLTKQQLVPEDLDMQEIKQMVVENNPNTKESTFHLIIKFNREIKILLQEFQSVLIVDCHHKIWLLTTPMLTMQNKL